jgi:TonB family protein
MIAATQLPVRPVPRNGSLPFSPTPSVTVANETDSFIPVLTLVIWSGCLLVGLAGAVWAYARPAPPAQEPPPITAEILNVELFAADSSPSPELLPTPNLLQPPPLTAPPVPSAPPPMAVAAPSPEIAFAVPITAPARIVPAVEASFRNLDAPISEPTPARLTPQSLTFGQGEGKQPAPEYPRVAQREGQEGVVTVLLSVGLDGRVLTAEAASPSPWPLLNDAAIRAVKNRWRFTPGGSRLFEVAIRFQLKK